MNTANRDTIASLETVIVNSFDMCHSAVCFMNNCLHYNCDEDNTLYYRIVIAMTVIVSSFDMCRSAHLLSS